MRYLRGKSFEEFARKIEFLNSEEDTIYINKELTKNLIIELLERCEVKTILLPESKFKRTNKKIIGALKEIGIEIESIKPITGRPTNKREIIKKYMQKNPKEISEITKIPIKTVEYHYYKLKNSL
ncbi:conserved hypothetical protein [Methanococcus vannielii SB]|uniref:Uncharacterized protein n=1 Tax=Methanococcus vannielii (strain ATCC 35089 / DSM 1224 / JCM 13029 / OCM 148 / SB) TaxID=406327 RepID=A6URW0_METVS|nr:hypothetical protein [Methanococcus vannielii]ABR55232.1 conserved hypothetical protein [Methanococcus vannielii SB]